MIYIKVNLHILLVDIERSMSSCTYRPKHMLVAGTLKIYIVVDGISSSGRLYSTSNTLGVTK